MNQYIENSVYVPEQKVLIPELYRSYLVYLGMSMLGSPTVKYTAPDKGCLPSDGFDCSGLIYYIMHEAKKICSELIIPEDVRNSREMFDYLGIIVHASLAKPGDLVFFSNNSGTRPKHVGMYMGQNSDSQRWFLHAPVEEHKPVSLAPLPYRVLSKINQPDQIYTENVIGYKRFTLQTPDSRRRQIPII